MNALKDTKHATAHSMAMEIIEGAITHLNPSKFPAIALDLPKAFFADLRWARHNLPILHPRRLTLERIMDGELDGRDYQPIIRGEQVTAMKYIGSFKDFTGPLKRG